MRRVPVLLVALLSSGALSGCLGVDAAAWWDREGILRVHLQPLPPNESDIGAFRNLTLTVWSVGVAVANNEEGVYRRAPHEFYFDPPLRVEMVENGTKGVEIPLLETRLELRAVQEVTLRVTVNETTLRGGRPIDGCFDGIRHEPPCVRVARDGIYPVPEPTFSPRRGELVTFVVPMGVHFSNGEYFVRAEVGEVRYAD